MSAPTSAPETLLPHDAARRSDRLAQTVLLLAKELWALRDRQIVLETVLAERGLAVTEAVDNYRPSGAVAERLARERQRFAEDIVAMLAPADAV